MTTPEDARRIIADLLGSLSDYLEESYLRVLVSFLRRVDR